MTARRKKPGRITDPLGHAKLLADLQESRRVQDALRSQVRRIADERNERERQREEAIAQRDGYLERLNIVIDEREQARRDLAAERAKPAPEPKELLAELATLRRQDERQRAEIATLTKLLDAAHEAQFDAEVLASELEQSCASLGRVIHLGKLQRENRNRRAAVRVES